MTRLLCLILIVAFSPFPFAVAEMPGDAPVEGAEAELTALVEAWIDAEVSGDRETLQRILHQDFLSTFASGKTLDRDAYIDFIVGLDIAPFSVRNESIRLHGDTAVVIDVSGDGKTKFTWVAVRFEGRWRVVVQTFSSVAAT